MRDLRAADLDGNGTISLDEFVSLSEKLHTLMDNNQTLSATEQLWSPAMKPVHVAAETIEMVENALASFHDSLRETTPATAVKVAGQASPVLVRYAGAGSRLLAKIFGGLIFGLFMGLLMALIFVWFGMGHITVITKFGLEHYERMQQGGSPPSDEVVQQFALDHVLPLAPAFFAAALLPFFVTVSLWCRGQSVEHWVFGLQLVDKATFEPQGRSKSIYWFSPRISALL